MWEEEDVGVKKGEVWEEDVGVKRGGVGGGGCGCEEEGRCGRRRAWV